MSEKSVNSLFEIIKYLFLGVGAALILYFLLVNWLAAHAQSDFSDLFMLVIWAFMTLIFILSLVCLAGTWKFHKRNKEDIFWARRFYKLLEIAMISGVVFYLFLGSLVLPFIRNLT